MNFHFTLLYSRKCIIIVALLVLACLKSNKSLLFQDHIRARNGVVVLSTIRCSNKLINNQLYAARTNVNALPKRHGEKSPIKKSRDKSKIDIDNDKFKGWSIVTKSIKTFKSKKNTFGKVKLLNNDLDRINDGITDELKCVHFDSCSGCTIKGNFTSVTPTLQRARKFFKTENIDVVTHMSAPTQWRTHVKLCVRPMSKWGRLKFGLYKA